MPRVSPWRSNRSKCNFFKRGAFFEGGLFFQKGVILPFPNLIINTCGKLIYCPRWKILDLKWCQECLLEDPIGQNGFFSKGGLWWGGVSKRFHFAICKCAQYYSKYLKKAYFSSQIKFFVLEMMPRVSTWRSYRSKSIFFNWGWGVRVSHMGGRVHQISIDFFKRKFFERPYDFLMWLGLKKSQTKFYENRKILKGG